MLKINFQKTKLQHLTKEFQVPFSTLTLLAEWLYDIWPYHYSIVNADDNFANHFYTFRIYSLRHCVFSVFLYHTAIVFCKLFDNWNII